MDRSTFRIGQSGDIFRTLSNIYDGFFLQPLTTLFLSSQMFNEYWIRLCSVYLEGANQCGSTYTARTRFPLKISLRNVTKSAVSCGFAHIY